jgi:hypothetical protein
MGKTGFIPARSEATFFRDRAVASAREPHRLFHLVLCLLQRRLQLDPAAVT